MPWIDDAPTAAFDEALLTLIQLRGQEGALDVLEDRARWLRAVINAKNARCPVNADTAKISQPKHEALIQALDALGFYADETSWRSRGRRGPAPARADEGKLARKTIEAIKGKAGEPE